MKTMESMLREECERLKVIIKEAQRRLKTAPNGQLRIMKKRNKPQYYYKSEDSNGGNARYMKKSEIELARKIAQRDYDIRLVRKAQKRVKAIQAFLTGYENTSLKQMYQKTNPYRRELVSTPIISDDGYIKNWQAVEYKGKQFAEEEAEYITERGERVRSKSEKIIADKLSALGIPYRYEYPLVLEGNIKIYPDFTILRIPGREEVYLEHLGMMDDESYVNGVMLKLSTYQRNEIYLGVNLFVTYETSRNPLNTKVLDKFLRELFCAE